MADEDCRCAWCCCRFVITCGLTALFLWLSLRTYNPALLIQDFYLPALNKTHNSTSNHTLFFNLALHNKMKDKGVSYSNISLSFLYYANLTLLAVANHTVPAFDQGHGKTAHRSHLLAAHALPWSSALAAVSAGGTVSFRVTAATRVRSKIVIWFTKSHSLVVSGDIPVDASGQKLRKKAIRLKSAAPETASRGLGMGILRLLITLFLNIFILL